MEQKSTDTDAADTNLSNPDRILTTSELVKLLENFIIEMRRILEPPHTDAESLQELRLLKRNQSVLGDTEMPSTSRGFTSHLEPEPETPKKIKSDDSQSEDAEDDDLLMTPGPGDKLGEDELTLIFSNTWLSAPDLLNFRLVSRRWRDAATTTLRRRDACTVELWADLDLDFHPLCVRKNIGKFKDGDKLSQLTELIALSPKFPATEFRIHMSFTPYTCFPDLLNFFNLHGDKIKTLRHHGKITARCLLDILQIYAPALESLDLSEAGIWESDEEDGGEGNALKGTSKAVSLKCLTLGMFGHICQQHKPQLFRLLLSSLSKLGSIENVTLDTLQMFLTEGKGHLIRSFKYFIKDAHFSPALLLTKLISLNPKPKLSKVTLDLQRQWLSTATIINSLNEFIESFKDTVQTLELFCRYHQHAWVPLLNVPPMRNLKSFTLKLWTGCREGHNADCRVCQEEGSKIFIGIRGTFFRFQDGILAQNYFPSLMEVHLHSNLSKFNQVSPMSFFSFKSDTDDGSPVNSIFPKVDILKINRIDVGSRYRHAGTCHSPTETSLVAEVFPNIRIFKFKCGEVSNLSSDLWALCPNVEFMEISGIGSCSSFGRDVEMSRFVDKVFTGSSDRMLRRLRRSGTGHQSDADDSEDFKFDPRISDLRRLRELKLKFVGKWSTKFASSVTGVHAFSKMENAKFIVSYDPEVCAAGFNGGKAIARRNKIDENVDAVNVSVRNRDDQIARYEEFIFGPLKPYVHIVHEKRKYEILVRKQEGQSIIRYSDWMTDTERKKFGG